MIKLGFEAGGIRQFNSELSLAMAALDLEITRSYVAWTKGIFRDLVMGSPQWSGDLASNWRYGVGAVDYTYNELPNRAAANQMWSAADVYERGAEPAVSIGMANFESTRKPTWRDKVYISNSTPIAAEVEAHTVKIRPENLLYGQVAMIQFVVEMERLRGAFYE